MDKKALIPVIGIALLASIALMLTVIGGLYAYNTFAESAGPVQAATDNGTGWSVTNLRIGSEDLIVVVAEGANMYEEGRTSKQMAIYQVKPQGNGRGELYLMAVRNIEYDMKLGYENKIQSQKAYTPAKLKEAFKKK